MSYLKCLISTYEEEIDQLTALFVETYFDTFFTLGVISYKSSPYYLSHLPEDKEERNKLVADIMINKIKERINGS